MTIPAKNLVLHLAGSPSISTHYPLVSGPPTATRLALDLSHIHVVLELIEDLGLYCVSTASTLFCVKVTYSRRKK